LLKTLALYEHTDFRWMIRRMSAGIHVNTLSKTTVKKENHFCVATIEDGTGNPADELQCVTRPGRGL